MVKVLVLLFFFSSLLFSKEDTTKYISWNEHIIDDSVTGPKDLEGSDGLVMADLDKDGYLDIISVHSTSGLRWSISDMRTNVLSPFIRNLHAGF